MAVSVAVGPQLATKPPRGQSNDGTVEDPYRSPVARTPLCRATDDGRRRTSFGVALVGIGFR